MSWLDGGVGGGILGANDDYLWSDIRPSIHNMSHIEKCKTAFEYDHHAVVAVSCGMLLLFGIVYSLFGYRCFKAVMFLTGFIFGSVVVYLICLSEALLPVLGNAGVSLVAGLMFGLITMLVQYVGLFMTGFHTGLFLGVAAIAAAYPWWMPGSVWMVVGILLGSGLLLAILTLYFQKGLTILGTAISGGALMAATLDYFIEKFVMVQWLVERLVLSSSSEMVCWYSWLILAVWPAMVVVGTLTQCCITSTGMYHTQLITSQNSRHVSLQRIRNREARAEVRQKKYRYLYQVRTAHGDIISQEYIQSLQRKAYPATSDNGTLQSDSTHTTMLPPDHTPLAPLTESEDEGADTSCSRKGGAGEHQRASINVHQQAQYQSRYPAQQQLSQCSINCSRDSGRGYSITGCSRGCSSQPHCSNTAATASSDCYNSSPSPDDRCSELLYTPSPHSSSPDNGRRSCINRPEQCYSGSRNTPSPSPPRPHCVPR